MHTPTQSHTYTHYTNVTHLQYMYVIIITTRNYMISYDTQGQTCCGIVSLRNTCIRTHTHIYENARTHTNTILRMYIMNIDTYS